MRHERLILLGLLTFLFSFTSKVESQKSQDNVFYRAGSIEEVILSKEIFKTDRLLLIPQTSKDYTELAELLLDHDVTRYIEITDCQYKTKEAALEDLQKWGNSGNWVIKLKDDTVIGSISFNLYPLYYSIKNFREYKTVDIGYFLGKKFWKQGFAREACTFLALKLFQCVDIKGLSITVHQENKNSINLAKVILDFVEKNCGMKVERKVNKYIYSECPLCCFWIKKVEE